MAQSNVAMEMRTVVKFGVEVRIPGIATYKMGAFIIFYF